MNIKQMKGFLELSKTLNFSKTAKQMYMSQPAFSRMIESMEKEKQSLQETTSKEQESYKSVFLKKRSVCNRQSVYISGEMQKRITQIAGVITGKQVSIGNFIDNVLEEHLNTHNDVLSALYREEMQKGIFNQPKEKDV